MQKLQKKLLATRRQFLAKLFRRQFVISTNPVAAFAFRPVKCGIRHLDQLDRIGRIIWKSGDADTYRDAVRFGRLSRAYDCELLGLDNRSYSLGGDDCLRDACVKKERGKFF